MPHEIIAYRCVGCQHLIQKGSKYLLVNNLNIETVVDEKATAHQRTYAKRLELIDVAVCDEICLDTYVRQGMTTTTL
jgi:hypothetical protein